MLSRTYLLELTIPCSDNAEGKRALGGDGYNNGTSMTNEDCALFCMDRGYSMAGTEYGAECCQFTLVPVIYLLVADPTLRLR